MAAFLALAACSSTPQEGVVQPALVQHVSGSNTRGSAFASPFCYHFQLANPTTAGNAVVVSFTYDGSATPSVSDDKNDPYAIELTYFDIPDNQSIGIAIAFNVRGGARLLNLCFDSAPGGYVQPAATEFANVIAADGPAIGSDGAGTAVTLGKMMPSATGDLVYQVAFSTSLNQSSFAAGSQPNINWNLLSADLMDGFAAQYGIYDSTAPLNPTLSMGTSQRWVSAGILLEPGKTGGVPTGMRIIRLIHENIPTLTTAGGTGKPFPQPVQLQVPHSGNLLVAMIGGGNPTNSVSSISDSENNVWTQAGSTQEIAGINTSQAYFAANLTASSDLRLTVRWAGQSGDFTILFYDVAGASASPLDTSVGGTGTQSTAGNLTLPFAITPAGANELIVVQTIWDYNTGAGLAGSGQLFDANSFDGERPSGPEPVDQNNGWGHVYSAGSAGVTFTWILQFPGLPVRYWAGTAVAFKPGP